MTDLPAMNADFESHHIEGYARAARERGESGYFKCGLISHVDGNLWQGGCIEGVRLPDDFKFVFSLYPWERYQLAPDTVRKEYRLYDAAEMPDVDQLIEIATAVNRACLAGKTLVHCQAGLNRSGLIAGLALVLNGMAPVDAITLLRRKRSPVVLCNQTFENWLLGFALPEAAA